MNTYIGHEEELIFINPSPRLWGREIFNLMPDGSEQAYDNAKNGDFFYTDIACMGMKTSEGIRIILGNNIPVLIGEDEYRWLTSGRWADQRISPYEDITIKYPIAAWHSPYIWIEPEMRLHILKFNGYGSRIKNYIRVLPEYAMN